MEGNLMSDIVDQVQAKNSPANASTKKAPVSAQKVLDDLEDRKLADLVETQIRKELHAPDLAQLRMISMASKVGTLMNSTTIALNIFESNQIQQVRDLQVRFREVRAGAGEAAMFNIEGTFPAEQYANRPMRDNTLGFGGQKLKIRIFAEEIANQSIIASTDERSVQMDFAFNRIRRLFNRILLSNTEIKAEVPPVVPQPGGFLTRSTKNTLALGAPSDLTNALIQGRVDAIANIASTEGYGYTPLVCFCNASQLQVVRSLMIARYPGQNSDAAGHLVSSLLSKVANVKVPAEMIEVYQPLPGMPVLFIYEPTLASGTALFFDPDQPQLGKMKLMNSFGPWALQRPTEDLTYIDYIWDGATMIDNLVESRAVITGLNP